MLFDRMPVWALGIWLAFACVLKYVAVLRLWHTESFQKLCRGPRWYIAMSLTAMVGGILMWGIFSLFAGPGGAVLLGVIDMIFHGSAAVYLRHRSLYVMNEEYLRHAVWIRVIHGVLYSGFIIFALFVQPPHARVI